MTYLVLLVFSYNVIFLFVGTASLGLFLSSTFPSMLAYTEDILQYRGECAGVGGCPWLVPRPLTPTLLCCCSGEITALPPHRNRAPLTGGNRSVNGVLIHVAPRQHHTCICDLRPQRSS